MHDTSKFRDTLTLLFQRFNALQRGEKRCFGVTMSQCVTLELLHREGRRTVRGLAEGLGLDPSTVSRVVDGLEREGLVHRTRDARRDRRRVFVSLSDRGRRLARRLEQQADAYCARILERIPRDRRDDVLHTLRVLVEALDELPEACG